MRLYVSDFDANGNTDPVLATHRDGAYYPLVNLDELAAQMPFLRKKYPTYRSFAGQHIEQLFEPEQLEQSQILEVEELRSGYLKNEDGFFRFIPFPDVLQTAPILHYLVADFNGDGKEEALAGGNYFGIKPYLGRLDAFPGALILNDTNILLTPALGLNFSGKSVRYLALLEMGEKNILLAVYNNESAEIFELTFPKHLNP